MKNNKWIRILVLFLLLSTISDVFMMQYAMLLGGNSTDMSEITDNDSEKDDKEVEEIEYDTVKYKLDLLIIEDNKEVWKTYSVDVIEAREDYGTYWIDNSKTEGHILKLDFNEDGYVNITEHTDDRIKVRHIASIKGGNIVIEEYNEIIVESKDKEVDKNETSSSSNE